MSIQCIVIIKILKYKKINIIIIRKRREKLNILDKRFYIQYEIGMLILSAIIFTAGIIYDFHNIYTILVCISGFLILRYFSLFMYDHKTVQIILILASFLFSLLFCFLSPHWFSFIMLIINTKGIDEINKPLKNSLIIVLPITGYIIFIISGLTTGRPFTLFITSIIILLCEFFFIAVDYMIDYTEKTDSTLRNALYNTALSELEQKNLNRQLSIQNSLADRNARYEEREKIGRTIHNVVGHTITSAIMALDASQVIYEVSHNEAVKKLEVANDRMHESLSSIRQAVRVMDDSNKPISINDLCDMLRLSINEFVMDTDIKIRHNISDTDSKLHLPADNAQFINGAMLELLSNGVRHGNADTFIILLTFDSTHIKLSVTDNGNVEDFDEKKFLTDGFGLRKIKDFVTRQGGSITLSCCDGLCAEIELPVI